MELSRLIDALSRPEAYADPVDAVEVHQTHISVVFLAGRHAYKIKKPVNLGFLNFRTLKRRRHFCEEEVRLNRRLAPAVYLGVVPIVWQDGVRVEGAGPVVEWAVKMQRLPEEATFQKRLQRGEVDADLVKKLAAKIAAFHRDADTSNDIARFGSFDVVAGNARENFAQAEGQVAHSVSRAVFERLRTLTEEHLRRHCATIVRRACPGVIRDTHGDLHLDHVYVFPERTPPDDLVIIDCIEFNERFRYADPVADMAFLVMDFAFHGRRDLGDAFAEAYFAAAGDGEARSLLPFYAAYRAVVRAKVEGVKLREREVPAFERREELTRAQAHWLLALAYLEEPARRPCLILIGGLPGTGKSTLARALADHVNFTVIRSDVVRKELAGIEPTAPATIAFEQGIYDSEWTERTYAECLRRAEVMLLEGHRVLVDANFREDGRRRTFLDAARRLAVPGLFVECRADPEVVRQRLQARRGDASDADWAIYEQAARAWEPSSPALAEYHFVLGTDGSFSETVARAQGALRERGLVS